MKRYLKHDRYRLDDHQAENLWYRIRGELKNDGAPAAPRRRAWRPAVATVAVLGVAAVAMVWWLADGRPGESPQVAVVAEAVGGAGPDVAMLELPAGDFARGGDPVAAADEPNPVKEADPVAPAAGKGPRSAEVAAVSPPSPSAAPEAAPLAVVASTAGVITGRVVDTNSQTAVARANVLVVGTTISAESDSTGAFRLDRLEPGRRYELQVMGRGYAPLDVAVDLPAAGSAVVACALEPMTVAMVQRATGGPDEELFDVSSSVAVPRVAPQVSRQGAVESVEEALTQQAGIARDKKELYARGGRSGEVSMKIDGVAQAPLSLDAASKGSASAGVAEKVAPRNEPARPRPVPGSVTGGTRPPNGQTFELMYFQHAGVNPFVATDEDALSTFALDVDTASFSLARSYLDRGAMPPPDAIRVEEFVNALDAGWPTHTKETFRIGLDGGTSQFGQGYELLRVGIVGRSLEAGRRKPANLVFVIDISGSMGRESRLGAVKSALHTLVDELGEGDRVGIVVYGSRGEVRLPLTDVRRRETILGIIDGLQTGGSTNAAEGLTLGYQVARDGFDRGIINRLILCSDGVANTGGATDADGILALARRCSGEGITLSTVGFGMGNYNDVLMEQLADHGDGNYFYVDGPDEARRVFRQNLTGMLQTIARQAKVQVEFDPRRVARWRLLGYENRDVADRDFRNDAVDAGEVGAGHQVTALYEIKLIDRRRGGDDGDDRIGTVHLRWEAPEHDADHAGKVTEIERTITRGMFAGSERGSSPQRRAQALAAEFAEILRGSYWAKDSRLSALVPLADDVARQLRGDAAVQDLARMIRRAADLERGRDRDDYPHEED